MSASEIVKNELKFIQGHLKFVNKIRKKEKKDSPAY